MKNALLCGAVLLTVGACQSDAPLPSGEEASTFDFSNITALTERGEELYNGAGECWDCHGRDALGADAPSLRHAPSAFDIVYQLNTNPEMGEVAESLDASSEDLVAMAVYLREVSGRETTADIVDDLVASLQSARDWSYSAP